MVCACAADERCEMTREEMLENEAEDYRRQPKRCEVCNEVLDEDGVCLGECGDLEEIGAEEDDLPVRQGSRGVAA
jgi:hypothetical protein